MSRFHCQENNKICLLRPTPVQWRMCNLTSVQGVTVDENWTKTTIGRTVADEGADQNRGLSKSFRWSLFYYSASVDSSKCHYTGISSRHEWEFKLATQCTAWLQSLEEAIHVDYFFTRYLRRRSVCRLARDASDA
jgi:hypothetical protein